MFTFDIQNSGVINNIILSTYIFHAHASEASIININNTVYALTYYARYGSALYGYLRTLDIASDGSTISLIDSGLNITSCQYPQIIPIDSIAYAVFYTESSSANGRIGTLRISNEGQISRYISSTQYFDAQLALATCVRPRPIHLDVNNFAITFIGSFRDFYLKTIQFALTPTQNLQRTILMKQSAYSIESTATTITATLRTSSGNKQLSLPLYSGWNYLVIAYDHVTITFYNIHSNITDKTTLACNQNVLTNTNPLYFGGFKGVYDEFSLYDECFTQEQILAFYQQEILP